MTELQPLAFDVVSVQSQVVYGRVGNNVAVPTLEALGLAVAAVPTVIFSNTPHYPTIHGGSVPNGWFSGYLQDLSARGALHKLRAILMGYLGNATQSALLARWIAPMFTARPGLRVIIDPVIGDHDHGVYVSADMVEAYRQHLLPLAHGLTPNGFELEQLTGRPVADIESVISAARMLLTDRTEWVAVTSAAPDTWAPGEMQVVLVTKAQAKIITHPRIEATPKGTGDLFSAALTGHWLNGAPLHTAIERACDQVVAALRHTHQAQSAELLLPAWTSRQAGEPNTLPNEMCRTF